MRSFSIYIACLALFIECSQPFPADKKNVLLVDTLNTFNEKDSLYIPDKDKDKDVSTDNCTYYNVWDIENGGQLRKNWCISLNQNSMEGYKDYNFIYPYMVINSMRNGQDDIKNCWALALGYNKEVTPFVKEAYFILEFDNFLRSSTYKVELEEIHDAQYHQFILRDTIILYQIKNESAFFCEKGVPCYGSFYGGEFVEPNKNIAEKFILGKPKYKLIRNK